MTLGKWSSVLIVVACSVVILSGAPAVLMDPLFLAVAQIRSRNAPPAIQTIEVESPVLTEPMTTSVKKTK